ncbi:phage tail protein [Sporofaciens sp. JLR.KK001]|jgi:phage minor structural protein|uniref:phage tail protein n=1 Tax=Sporofaciens sp. JLR.KK001 TaxID=3112621 RepID=UPI002FF21A61
MAVKSTLNKQTDFTGEFPAEYAKDGLWRFNENAPDADTMLSDSSGQGRKMFVSGWSGTSAGFRGGQKGRHFRMNTSNPASEKTYLKVTNDGTIFQNPGERITVGGWINPTTYSVGNTYCPIFNTRQGPGQPIFYLSLIRGKPRIMLYNSSGTLILDESVAPPFSFVNNGWYFLACVIEPGNKKAQYVIGDRESGAVWVSAALSFTGELNRSCTADLIMGMNAGSYWYAGGFDDWFLDCDSQLTAEGLADYFRKSLCANGGDTSREVDALTEPGCVTLRKGSGGVYPETGQLLTAPAECLLAGTGRVSVKSEYTAGVTAVSLVETSTSDDLEEWTAWQGVGSSGELQSPNQRYIRYRVTFTTTDTSKTPKLMEIQLHDIPKPPYERLGFARPVILDSNGAWEAVLENAFDIMVTSEVNGADTLEFKLPFRDSKRPHLDNEKQVQIVNDVYRIRTLTDDKGADGKVVTSVYAEAAFYDLAFSVEKATVNFNADTAEAPMAYALEGTDWSVGNVTVRTKRTWQSTEKNALSILRQVQNIHGGDLIFDCANHLVHLLTFGGTDSGVLFAYRKNMKSIQRVVDTRSLVTRLYAYGKDGMTFASINGGKEYVESYAYTDEVRTSTLDCSSFTNPYQMLEFAEMRLADYAKPRISYVLSAMDLSVLTGYEHETWNLGDIVTVDDRDLNLSVKTRIVRRQYNLQEPWNTVLELSTTLRELGDSSAQWDKAADVLSNTDVIDRQEVKDMVPFNHLRNSRADSGMSGWLNSGFEVDAENGVSGTASFKCAGAAGMTKSLAQTVYPASRSSYTFSAQIASENLKKGAGGQVGIEVTFEYEDGTTETRFIDLL